MEKVILVLDTSWLMEIGRYTFNPLTKMLEEKILNKGEDVEIWIHGRVLRELDGLKNVADKSHQARIASRYLREALNAFKSRIKISDFGVLKPEKEFRDSITSEVDAIILTLAKKAKKMGKVYLFTTDNNMKILGVNVNVEIVDNVFNHISIESRTVSSENKPNKINISSMIGVSLIFLFLAVYVFIKTYNIQLSFIIVIFNIFLILIILSNRNIDESNSLQKYDNISLYIEDIKAYREWNKNKYRRRKIFNYCNYEDDMLDPACKNELGNIFYNDV